MRGNVRSLFLHGPESKSRQKNRKTPTSWEYGKYPQVLASLPLASIIANDFVSFAPDGVTVTVYPSEGFESERCAPWTKIG